MCSASRFIVFHTDIYMPEIIAFDKVAKPFGWMGNMSPFPVEHEGRTYRTSEALFQCLRFTDPEIIEEIRGQASPMAAKMKARLNRNHMKAEAMSAQDLGNMRLCLRLKVLQHDQLKAKLLATGESVIHENIGNRRGERHLFWGARLVEGQWVGQSWLGRLWMELRQELRSSAVETAAD